MNCFTTYILKKIVCRANYGLLYNLSFLMYVLKKKEKIKYGLNKFF